MDGDKKPDFDDSGQEAGKQLKNVTTPTEPEIRPRTSSTSSKGARSRHSSGNNPNIRGIIIESQTSRDNSPIRSSPFQSPGVSPGPYVDRTFGLPSTGFAQPRIPSSISDNVLNHGGARPKTHFMTNGQDARPKSDRPRNGESSPPSSRRHTISESHPRSRRNTENESSCSGSSVQEVKDQTEEIMKNYMYERYNKDLMSPDSQENLPPAPVMFTNFSPNPQTKCSEVGRQLAKIGDDVDAMYSATFKKLSKSLNIRKGAADLAYEAFSKVCRKLFDDGVISWGRIITLLQFGYHLAMDVLRQGISSFMTQIIKFLVRFIATETISQACISIAEWISQHGGWQAVSLSDLTSSSFITVGVAVLGASLIGLLMYWKPWMR